MREDVSRLLIPPERTERLVWKVEQRPRFKEEASCGINPSWDHPEFLEGLEEED